MTETSVGALHVQAQTRSRSPSTGPGPSSPAPAVPSSPAPARALSGMARVRALHAELTSAVSDTEARMRSALAAQEEEFLTAFRAHMYAVQQEVVALRGKAEEAAQRLARSERIRALEGERNFYRGEALRLDGLVAGGCVEVRELRLALSRLRDDNAWLAAQLRAAKRQLLVAGHAAEATSIAQRGVSPQPGAGTGSGVTTTAKAGQNREARARSRGGSTGSPTVPAVITPGPPNASQPTAHSHLWTPQQRQASLRGRALQLSQSRAAAPPRQRAPPPATHKAAARAEDDDGASPPGGALAGISPGELRSLLSQCVDDARAAMQRRRRSALREGAGYMAADARGRSRSGSRGSVVSCERRPVSLGAQSLSRSLNRPEADSLSIAHEAASASPVNTTTRSHAAPLSPSHAAHQLSSSTTREEALRAARAEQAQSLREPCPGHQGLPALGVGERRELIDRLLGDERLADTLTRLLQLPAKTEEGRGRSRSAARAELKLGSK